MKKIIFSLALLEFFLLVSPVSALSVSVHVPEKYTEVEAGERFYFEIEIKYPENYQREDLILNYEILDMKGEVITQSKVLKAVETQASFIDFIVIPENAKNGLYTIKVKIGDYEYLSEEIEASFQIVNKTNQLKVYFYILVGLIISVGIVISWEVHKIKRR